MSLLQPQPCYQRQIFQVCHVWADDLTCCLCTPQTVKLAANGIPFRVAGKNDELISVRRFYSHPLQGAIMGVEMKKRLSWASVRQAEAEFLLFGQNSMYPFCQVSLHMLAIAEHAP